MSDTVPTGVDAMIEFRRREKQIDREDEEFDAWLAGWGARAADAFHGLANLAPPFDLAQLAGHYTSAGRLIADWSRDESVRYPGCWAGRFESHRLRRLAEDSNLRQAFPAAGPAAELILCGGENPERLGRELAKLSADPDALADVMEWTRGIAKGVTLDPGNRCGTRGQTPDGGTPRGEESGRNGLHSGPVELTRWEVKPEPVPVPPSTDPATARTPPSEPQPANSPPRHLGRPNAGRFGPYADGCFTLGGLEIIRVPPIPWAILKALWDSDTVGLRTEMSGETLWKASRDTKLRKYDRKARKSLDGNLKTLRDKFTAAWKKAEKEGRRVPRLAIGFSHHGSDTVLVTVTQPTTAEN